MTFPVGYNPLAIPFTLPYPNLSWIYEGTVSTQDEDADGAVINRTCRQIQVNLDAIAAACTALSTSLLSSTVQFILPNVDVNISWIYEGTDQNQWELASGVNLNRVPRQLLTNIDYIANTINDNFSGGTPTPTTTTTPITPTTTTTTTSTTTPTTTVTTTPTVTVTVPPMSISYNPLTNSTGEQSTLIISNGPPNTPVFMAQQEYTLAGVAVGVRVPVQIGTTTSGGGFNFISTAGWSNLAATDTVDIILGAGTNSPSGTFYFINATGLAFDIVVNGTDVTNSSAPSYHIANGGEQTFDCSVSTIPGSGNYTYAWSIVGQNVSGTAVVPTVTYGATDGPTFTAGITATGSIQVEYIIHCVVTDTTSGQTGSPGGLGQIFYS